MPRMEAAIKLGLRFRRHVAELRSASSRRRQSVPPRSCRRCESLPFLLFASKSMDHTVLSSHWAKQIVGQETIDAAMRASGF